MVADAEAPEFLMRFFKGDPLIEPYSTLKEDLYAYGALKGTLNRGP